MLLQKIWKKIRKPVLVFLILFLSFFVSFLLIETDNNVYPTIWEGLLKHFWALLTVCLAMLPLIYTYIDNIMKDLQSAARRDAVNECKYKKASNLLTGLKTELLKNIMLSVFVFFIDLSVSAIAKIPELHKDYSILLSIRICLFIFLALLVVDIIRGFIVANRYRDIINL